MTQESVSIRIYWKLEGANVHCRVFSSPTGDTTGGKNGDLVFTEAEWSAAASRFRQGGIEVVEVR